MKHFMGKHAKYLQKRNNLKVHTIVVLKITLNICSFFHLAYAYRTPTRYCWSWRYSLASRSCLVKNKSIICIYPGVTNGTVKIITKYMQEDMTSEHWQTGSCTVLGKGRKKFKSSVSWADPGAFGEGHRCGRKGVHLRSLNDSKIEVFDGEDKQVEQKDINLERQEKTRK